MSNQTITIKSLIFIPLIGACLLLSGCLTSRPAVDNELPNIRLQINNAHGLPAFDAPNPTLRGQNCVFIDDEAAEILMLVSDGGGMLSAGIQALSGEILGDLGDGITIQPMDGNVRGRLDRFGGDDTLILQFADRGGESLTGATAELSVTDFPVYLFVEATDRSGNTQQFGDTIELRRTGTAAGGSCIGG